MAVAREETFGPVAPLSASNGSEAVALANDTNLASLLIFMAKHRARLARSGSSEYGIVGSTLLISTEVAPFGVKESGLAVKAQSYGMDEYLEIKYLCFGASPSC